MQLVAHSPLMRQTACSSPTEMPHAYQSWRRRAGLTCSSTSTIAALTRYCVRTAHPRAVTSLSVVVSISRFLFLVSSSPFWRVLSSQFSQFLILVHRLATAEAGQIIKFQEAPKQNSAQPAEIPNSPEQIPMPALKRPHRIQHCLSARPKGKPRDYKRL